MSSVRNPCHRQKETTCWNMTREKISQSVSHHACEMFERTRKTRKRERERDRRICGKMNLSDVHQWHLRKCFLSFTSSSCSIGWDENRILILSIHMHKGWSLMRTDEKRSKASSLSTLTWRWTDRTNKNSLVVYSTEKPRCFIEDQMVKENKHLLLLLIPRLT